MIKATNLNKYFNKHKKNELHVINNVSLALPEKGLIVLFGPSGGGKTTLLNVIGGLDKASGSLYYNNKDYSRYNMRKWDYMRSQDIGYIFQNYLLIGELSVYENIKMTLEMIGITDKKQIDERIEYVLDSVGLKKFKKRRASQLSGGQQQRVAIARALAKNPRVIIADEPTGNLDSKNTLEIMNIIKKLSDDKLVLLVTHEPSIANHYADRILKIEDGKIVEDYINEHSQSGMFIHQSDIYLEELDKQTFKDEETHIDLYGDFKDASIRLVHKDGTIYIDLGLDKKVVIIDDNSETKLIEGKKEATIYEETSAFDYNKHIQKPTHKTKFSFITLRRSIMLAFNQILNASRRRKVLLFGFILSGVLIAIMSTLLTITFDSKNNQFFYPKEQLHIEGDNYTAQSLLTEDEAIIYGAYVVKYKAVTFDQIGEDNNPLVRVSLLPAHIKTPTMIYGRDIKDDQSVKEITLDKTVAINFLNTSSSYLKALGYELKDLINLDVYLNGETYTIVGITDYHYGLTRINYNNAKILYMKSSHDVAGKTDEELIGLYDELGHQGDAVVYSKNYKETKTRLEQQGMIVLNDYEREYAQFMAIRRASRNAMLITILVISSLIWLSLYFIIRSNLFSRIDEIKVYRALGVRRLEIVKIFFVEVFVLTTVTSLIGFLVMMYFIINNNLFTNFNMVLYTPIQMGLAIIFMYVFNLIFGTLPVLGLLRKTPAAIIAQAEA